MWAEELEALLCTSLSAGLEARSRSAAGATDSRCTDPCRTGLPQASTDFAGA